MDLADRTYVPSLKWRKGEYQALVDLTVHVKERIVPLITIPNVEFDFEKWEQAKSVQDHVAPFAARYRAKWHTRKAWLGVDNAIVGASMDSGMSVLEHVFTELRAFGARATPVIQLRAGAKIMATAREIVAQDGRGAAVALRLQDVVRESTWPRIRDITRGLGIDSAHVDLIVDMGAPNFCPYDVLVELLSSTLETLPRIDDYRNVVLLGTALPASLAHIGKGMGRVPRHDWKFYRRLLSQAPPTMRRPLFGDYAIVHPNFVAVDMRLIKPAGKLVYATNDEWLIYRGGAFRDDPDQMHDHCSKLLNSGEFCGAAYSRGDDYIAGCGTHQVGPSNQTRWKTVGIDHHITRVVNDLANPGGGP